MHLESLHEMWRFLKLLLNSGSFQAIPLSRASQQLVQGHLIISMPTFSGLREDASSLFLKPRRDSHNKIWFCSVPRIWAHNILSSLKACATEDKANEVNKINLSVPRQKYQKQRAKTIKMIELRKTSFSPGAPVFMLFCFILARNTY